MTTRPCLDCASDRNCQLFRVQLAYSADAIWFEAVWDILREKEHTRWFTHAVCEIMSHIRFSNYFISYLMKIYELYLTYSIIIISPAPDRDWDGALHVVPNLSQQARHQLEIGFLRSAFLETADQTPPSDYRPIMIGSRSIGAPLVKNKWLIRMRSSAGIKPRRCCAHFRLPAKLLPPLVKIATWLPNPNPIPIVFLR